jgi:hypothetical protein
VHADNIITDKLFKKSQSMTNDINTANAQTAYFQNSGGTLDVSGLLIDNINAPGLVFSNLNGGTTTVADLTVQNSILAVVS